MTENGRDNWGVDRRAGAGEREADFEEGLAIATLRTVADTLDETSKSVRALTSAVLLAAAALKGAQARFSDARLPSQGGGFNPNAQKFTPNPQRFSGAVLPSAGGGFSPGSTRPAPGGRFSPGSRLPSQGGGFSPGASLPFSGSAPRRPVLSVDLATMLEVVKAIRNGGLVTDPRFRGLGAFAADPRFRGLGRFNLDIRLNVAPGQSPIPKR